MTKSRKNWGGISSKVSNATHEKGSVRYNPLFDISNCFSGCKPSSANKAQPRPDSQCSR